MTLLFICYIVYNIFIPLEGDIMEDNFFDIDIAEFEGLPDDIDGLDFGVETEQQRYINPGKRVLKTRK